MDHCDGTENEEDERSDGLQIKLVEKDSGDHQDQELQDHISHQADHSHLLGLESEGDLSLHLLHLLVEGIDNRNRADCLPDDAAPESNHHHPRLGMRYFGVWVFIFRERLGLDIVDKRDIGDRIQEGRHTGQTD